MEFNISIKAESVAEFSNGKANGKAKLVAIADAGWMQGG